MGTFSQLFYGCQTYCFQKLKEQIEMLQVSLHALNSFDSKLTIITKPNQTITVIEMEQTPEVYMSSFSIKQIKSQSTLKQQGN